MYMKNSNFLNLIQYKNTFLLHMINITCLEYMYVFQNALALTKGILPSDLSQKAAPVMRQYVTNKIITSATKPPAQYTVCDFVDCQNKKRGSKWIQCDVCGRWLHFSCLGIKEKPPGDYKCIICNAQYE